MGRAFPILRAALGEPGWTAALSVAGPRPDRLPARLNRWAESLGLPPWAGDLARIELAKRRCGRAALPEPASLASPTVNPSLQIVECGWSGLAGMFADHPAPLSSLRPRPEWVLVWKRPGRPSCEIRPASREELLSLKIRAEDRDPRDVAAEGGVPVGRIDAMLESATWHGILLSPPSGLTRAFVSRPNGPEVIQRPEVFTLQWHITQACDLHCRHCYDRSPRAAVTLEQAVAILDGFRDFCRSRYVDGQVSLSGGNPLLHPQFLEIYQAAADRNLQTAILGNPASREMLEKIVAIQRPAFYQVSLEGLADHNDEIRGAGHFQRVMDFLPLLRELKVYSMVMLTLTRANAGQVLPLAECLRDRADLFTFNRLSAVGEGAGLAAVDQRRLEDLETAYLAVLPTNPVMAMKDNLINAVLYREGRSFGGCTGFGCGAAFNFVSVLPDGEAHACRKFPSPIGNVLNQGWTAVYESDAARLYRRGPDACRGCPIEPGCRGCLAVVHASGGDVGRDRDPQCFFEHAPTRERPSRGLQKHRFGPARSG